ncbi:paramyosin-like [Palaemon carinicauda]|uniref:paramyosin-like n=1 Tax=Palaemon carinicauda TaxID=392227 RepID=UPI0035B5DB2B
MAFKLNAVISMFKDIIGNKVGFVWPQNAGSALQEQTLACEDMTVKLQGQLRTLQESVVFKWFSWLLPEAPRFENCRAVASQDGFLGRWLQRCPWIGGWWKAREELQRCELGLHQMEREVLGFKDELKSTWFVGKLLSGFDFEERKEEVLSYGNNFYIGMAAASVILGGIMLARRRMAGEGGDNNSLEENVPEMEHGCEDLLDGIGLKMEDEDRTTLLENLMAENAELRGQIEGMGRLVEIKENLQSDCNEKDLQLEELEKLMENIKNENEVLKKEQNQKNELVTELKKEFGELKAGKTKLECEFIERNIQMKELEKLMENIKNENEVLKTEENQKNELVTELKKEFGELKAGKTKLECEFIERNIQMKELEKLMENIKNENEVLKTEENQKNELVNELKKEVGELKAESEKLKADMTQEYEKLEFMSKIKDLEVMERNMIAEKFETENEEIKKAHIKIMEQLNKLKSVVYELKAKKEKLEAKCAEKDLQLKKLKNWLEDLRNENEKFKTSQNEKTENLNKLKREVVGLKVEKNKLKSECLEKERQLGKMKNLLEDLRNENEKVKNNQYEEMDQLNKLKREVDQLKEEREKLKADRTQEYEKLEFMCKIKDLEVMERNMIAEKFETEKEEMKKAHINNMEQLNELKSVVCELKAENERLVAEKAEVHRAENNDEHRRKSLVMAGLFAQMNNRYKEAVEIFTEALSMETHYEEETALLHVLRAEANSATEKPPHMDIVLDCSMAIEKGLEGWKAYMIRGRHLVKLGIFDAALKDFETVKVKKSEKFLKILEDTKALQKEWEEKGHYEILGLEQTATKAEIIRSFKDLSMAFHPDRHRDKPEFLQEAFEEKYKKVVNAKLILVDEGNRRDYDEELRHEKKYDHWYHRYRQEPTRHQPGQWNQQRWQYDQGRPRRQEDRQYDQGRPRWQEDRQYN